MAAATMPPSTQAVACQLLCRKLDTSRCSPSIASVMGSLSSRTSTSQKYHSRYMPDSNTKAPDTISTYCIFARSQRTKPMLAVANASVSDTTTNAMPME